MTLLILTVCLLTGCWVSGAPSIPYLRESRRLYTETIATSVISSAPPGARLFSAKGDLPPLINRLVQNATNIRRNIVDTFRCDGRVYGYYADQDNECQIFHICVPMEQLFPDLYDAHDIYQFSFICPAYTIFTQDAMVCAWVDMAFPCSEAHLLYDRNNHFFVVPAEEVYRENSVTTTALVSTPEPVLLRTASVPSSTLSTTELPKPLTPETLLPEALPPETPQPETQLPPKTPQPETQLPSKTPQPETQLPPKTPQPETLQPETQLPPETQLQ
ncbi:hypothetical protein OTU49_008418 [Cherax quadricarinatus]|uniref:Chitin-binding type-2 domain-containing protein n=1 Tax=Cherax quadricarinatus TaxID=27406 RepID=A0AAW0WG89_CHEQU